MTDLKNGKNKFLDVIPVYIRNGGKKIPVMMKTDGTNFQEKIIKFFGFNTGDEAEFAQKIKPWAIIDVEPFVKQPAKLMNHTDMDFIREFYLPVLNKLQPSQMTSLMDRFIAGGKRKFRELMKDGEDQVFIAFTGGITFCIWTGRNIDPRSLTFSRICALLGETV